MLEPEIILSTVGLTKQYRNLTAVDGIQFSLNRGECLGLLGPNGAGKTTLMKMIIGHAIQTAGTISLFGHELPKHARAMRRRIGVVPQFDNLDPDLTIQENLEIYASYFGFSQKDATTRAAELMTFAALTDRNGAKVNTLSGGMKRRLSLARALLNHPELLILDEPTTGLDPQARQVMWERLRVLKQQGATLILTTHYLEEAERLCDRILVIDHGRILAEGTPRGLIAEHIEPCVLEIHTDGVLDPAAVHALFPKARVEKIGTGIFCYAANEAALTLPTAIDVNWELLHRRANLEDVFLKLTGRELRE